MSRSEKNQNTEKPKRSGKKLFVISLVAIVAFVVIGGGARFIITNVILNNIDEGSSKLNPRKTIINEDPDFLNVAIYPSVPNLDYMETICAEMFEKVAPEVKLNFVDWNCYFSVCPDNIDVIMYDAIFLDELYNRGYLQELDEKDFSEASGIMPFTFNDTKIENKTYGIPNMICAYFLIYRKGDTDLEKANNIYDVYNALGDCKSLLRPPKNKGLVAYYSDNYAYYYLESLMDEYSGADIYSNTDHLSDNATDALEKITDMCGKWEAYPPQIVEFFNHKDYGEWFNDGYGRAYLGFSEELTSMSPNIDNVDIKLISMSEDENTAMFYTDLVSINTCVKDEKKLENCKKLVELLTSSDYLYTIGLNDGTAAYLLPAREDLFPKLAQEYPMYNNLKRELDKSVCHVSRFGSWYSSYIDSLYDILPSEVK